MFGPSIKTVFRSRWHALLWSAGILATTYCSVPAPEQERQEASRMLKSAAAATHAAGHAAHKAGHHNPWAN